MAKKFTLFVVILSVLVLCVVLSACGDTPATTTPEAPAATTTEPANNDPDSTTKPEDRNTEAKPPVTDEPDDPLLPNEQLADDLVSTAPWITPHEPYNYVSRLCTDNVERMVFYVSIKTDDGKFPTVPADDLEYPGVPGWQLTEGKYVLVRDLAEADTADFSKYEITYWEPFEWYRTYVGIDGFVPEDGHSYEFYWVVESGEKGATEPSTIHYIWDLGNYWEYIAPIPPESGELDPEVFEALIHNRTQLVEHEATTIGADGALRFSFKSDGDPFSQTEDGIYGVSMTLMGELYINGEKYEIALDSYQPEQWYIINFTIADFIPVDGETYEVVFTVETNDPTGSYCKDPDGYFVVVTVNYVAPVTPAE